MQRHKLSIEKRTVLGKKVKKLRKTGMLPANIYGKDIKSLAVQVSIKGFEAVFKEAGETGLIDLSVDGQIRPVLIHNVQFDHLTQQPVHADFYQVNLKEKVKTMVRLVVVGEPKAVTDKVGLLLQPLTEVEVEALPTDLPEHIEIPVEHLAAIDEQITVGQLKAPQGVEILTDKEQIVAKITELVSKEAAEQAEAEAKAAEAAKAEAGAPAEEGQAPSEGGAKPEEKTEQKPQEAAKEESKPQ